MSLVRLLAIAAVLHSSLACEADHGCYGEPEHDIVLTRNVRRMQPDAQNATTGPKSELPWGQINFLHTTDTRRQLRPSILAYTNWMR